MSFKSQITIKDKMRRISLLYVILVTAICSFGFFMLYSAAGGSLQPWAGRQMLRFVVYLGMMLFVVLIDIRQIFRFAYIFYGGVVLLLILVEAMGVIGMGAQRWINLGFIRLQPSELMKIGIALALARYFHGLDLDEVLKPRNLIIPVLMILLPVGLVLLQPDLGTAIKISAVGCVMLFYAGVHWGWFALGITGFLAALPIAWNMLHDYQQQRVLTFLDPERDPLGSGYHILQSKIALGSGGVFGKGFLQGSQSHLNFLPEKQTDFIFTMLAEELGLLGAASLILLYAAVTAYGFFISLSSHSQFGRLLGLGITANFFFYFFINIAMVMGLLPVVGVPLPLVSYGGTAMLSVLFGCALILNVQVHRDVRMTRRGALV